MFQKENIFGLLLAKQAKPTERERKRSFRLVFLIYASNEPKSGLARDLGDCLQSRNVPFGTSGDSLVFRAAAMTEKKR